MQHEMMWHGRAFSEAALNAKLDPIPASDEFEKTGLPVTVP